MNTPHSHRVITELAVAAAAISQFYTGALNPLPYTPLEERYDVVLIALCRV